MDDRTLEIRRKVLWRLFRHHYIGGKHTSIDNLRKGFAKSDYKAVDRVISDLIKDGFLLKKPTFYGLQVSLNPRKIQEIRQIIES
jgi:hypothetical protein